MGEQKVEGILYPTRQWRIVREDGVAHLEIELDDGWNRDFVAEKFPKSFAAQLCWQCYEIGRAGKTVTP